MREILFRGKRVDNKEWVYGDLIHTRGGHPLICARHDFGSAVDGVEVDYNTVCQYTGMTDKNSKKIFEGDIIEDCNNRIGYVAWLPQECGYVVVWGKSDSRLGHRNRGSGYYRDTTISVIGNIHDNPDLMKGREL